MLALQGFMRIQPIWPIMADDVRQDEDPVEQTIRTFERYQSEQHTLAVIDILDDVDDQRRTRALQLLADGEVTPSSVTPILPAVVSLTTDPDPDVRNAVRELIAKLADSCAEHGRPIPDLSTLLTHDDDEIRRDALHAASVVGERRPSVLRNEIADLADLLSDRNAEIRHLAAVVLGHAAKTHPDEVSEASETLVDLLETDDALVKGGAARALASLSEDRPGDVADAVPAVCSEINADIVDTGPLVETLANVARELPSRVRKATPALVDVASMPATDILKTVDRSSAEIARENERRLEQGTTRARAIAALESVAEHDADAVARYADKVAPLVTADVPGVRERSLELLSALGTERPETIETVVPYLIDHLQEAPPDAERERTHGVLMELSDVALVRFARGTRRRFDTLVDMLSHDDAGLRGAAAGFLSYVAEHDPDAVASLDEMMIHLLNDDSSVVRGNAALVLGVCGSDDAREALAALDPDEPFVATAVERALDRLDDRGVED